MKEFIWKFGEKPDKSLRPLVQTEDEIITDKKKNIETIEKNLEFEIINKRESVDAKLNDRQLVGQRNGNPFFSNSSYLDDLKTHDDYLIPKNSNFNYK